MMTNSLIALKDVLHAQLCYQLFITPVHVPIEKKYRDYARIACEFIQNKRSEVIHQERPRHHVIHRFKPKRTDGAKKVLITHGWASRSAYMVSLIRTLQHEGYDVYAIDFPAHGESKGLQITWIDAVSIIRHVLNEYGPFYAAIGHSFGGSMLLNTLNLAGQMPEWHLNSTLERAVLLASPVQMRSPVNALARKFKLSGHAYLYLRQLFREQEIDPMFIRLRHFIDQKSNIPFLCVHGQQDETIAPQESVMFCSEYKNSTLCLLDNADHVSVLMDKRVEQEVVQFLKYKEVP